MEDLPTLFCRPYNIGPGESGRTPATRPQISTGNTEIANSQGSLAAAAVQWEYCALELATGACGDLIEDGKERVIVNAATSQLPWTQ